MPDHPSIQGLREAVRQVRCIAEAVRGPGYDDPTKGPRWVCGYDRFHGACFEEALRAYLTEHGVLLSGEGMEPKSGEPSSAAVLAWARERWPDRCHLEGRVTKLAEEAGEVVGAVVRIEEGRGSQAHLAKELAQLVMCIKGVAAVAGIDMRAAVTAEWADMQTRQWSLYPVPQDGET